MLSFQLVDCFSPYSGLMILSVRMFVCLACADDQFQCVMSGRCINESSVCDGYNDCGDLSDEQNCSKLPLFTFVLGYDLLKYYITIIKGTKSQPRDRSQLA